MELSKGYNRLYEELIKVGVKPVLHQLDNEPSEEVITMIEKNGMRY